MHRFRTLTVATSLVVALGATACGNDTSTADPPSSTEAPASSTTTATSTTTASTEPVIDPGDGGDYAPELDPADFVATVDNPYLPFVSGSTWSYEETNGDGETENIAIVVLDETRDIEGITATVVRDTVTLDGVLVEDTHDWFAQDTEGNVWYLGEAVDNYDEQGQLVDHDGSFEHGVDGAFGGIVMLADPQVGEAYRQEYFAGEAEDLGEVVRTGETISVPFGDFEDVIVTRDWNPLEPDVVEEKYFAPGVGLVYETKVQGDTGEAVLVDAEVVAG